MEKLLILTPDAQRDIDDAFSWYEEQSIGLGKEFIYCVDSKLSYLILNTSLYQVVHKSNIKRAFISRFPFSIYFIDEAEIITVIAIIHQNRNPDSWKSRI